MLYVFKKFSSSYQRNYNMTDCSNHLGLTGDRVNPSTFLNTASENVGICGNIQSTPGGVAPTQNYVLTAIDANGNTGWMPPAGLPGPSGAQGGVGPQGAQGGVGPQGGIGPQGAQGSISAPVVPLFPAGSFPYLTAPTTVGNLTVPVINGAYYLVSVHATIQPNANSAPRVDIDAFDTVLLTTFNMVNNGNGYSPSSALVGGILPSYTFTASLPYIAVNANPIDFRIRISDGTLSTPSGGGNAFDISITVIRIL